MRPPSTVKTHMYVVDILQTLGVSRPTLYRLIRNGEFITPFKIGRRTKWFSADVYEWLGKNRRVGLEPESLATNRPLRSKVEREVIPA